MKTLLEGEDLVTSNLLSQLKVLADLNSDAIIDGLEKRVKEIMNCLCSWCVYSEEVGLQTQTDLAMQLLEQACLRVLKEADIPRLTKGFFPQSVQEGPLSTELKEINRILINIATPSHLESLPFIGSTLAEHIVEERDKKGSYTSIEDLINRVRGLGEQAKQHLAHVFSYLSPIKAQQIVTLDECDFDTCILGVLSLVDNKAGPAEKLLGALDLIATVCGVDVIGLTTNDLLLELREETDFNALHANVVSFFENSQYYFELPKLFEEAEHSISVLMFHIAFPEQNHPTRILLDSLIQAHRKGVNVRVILDRDRTTDPYHSTMINTQAKEYLEAVGILCRFDTEERLLHSKVIVIDEKHVVIGSHNWSAGSYFQFDDLSFVISSSDYGLFMPRRFESIWQEV